MPHNLAHDSRRIRLDIDSFRLAAAAETWLTDEDWADAVKFANAPAYLKLQPDEILVRRPGPDPAYKRWYKTTQRDVLHGTWPPRLGSISGEECERASAWCLERDCRLPVYGAPADDGLLHDRPHRSIGVARVPEVVRAPTHTDLMVTPESIPDLSPSDVERPVSASGEIAHAEGIRASVRYVMPENAPGGDAPVLTWHLPTIVGWCLVAVVLGLMLVAVCS